MSAEYSANAAQTVPANSGVIFTESPVPCNRGMIYHRDESALFRLASPRALGVGCCLDMGHSVRSGEDIAKIVKKYHKWIYDIHIKDETAASKEGWTWEMGRGVIDFKPIVKALRKVKYQGVISIEFEKNPDNPHPGIAESVGYLRGVMDATK